MAGEFNAGSVVAKLKLVDDGFGSKLSQAFASTSKFEKGLMAAGAAAVAVGTTIAVLTQQSADYTDKLGKLAQQIGMTTEQLSSYSLAASLSDISTEEFGKSVSLLSRKMVDAASGNEEASKSFAQLGISVKNANGTLKTSDQVLEEIADQFANTKDSATKTALAMDLMGRSGASMIPLLNGGSKEIKNIREEAMKMGLVFSQDAFKAAEQFNDSQTRIGQSLIGLRQQIGETIISLVNQTGVFDLVAKAVQAVTGWWMGLSESTREAIVATLGIVTAGVAAAAAFTAISTAASALLPILLPMLATLGPIALALVAIGAATFLVIKYWDNLMALFVALKPIITPVFDAFKTFLSIAWAPVVHAVTTIKEVLGGMKDFKVPDLTLMVITNLVNPLERFGLHVVHLTGKFLPKAFKDFFKAILDQVTNWADTIGAVIQNAMTPGTTITASDIIQQQFRDSLGAARNFATEMTSLYNRISSEARAEADRSGAARIKSYKDELEKRERMRKEAEGEKPEVKGPAASGGTDKPDDKKEGPSVLDEIDKWNAKITSFASKITQDLGQIAQNNLTKISNFASTWVDVFSKHLDKAHQAEMEQLQQVENDKLDILRAALDARLALINEEFNARKRALEAELAAEKRAIDAMTQARILEAQMKSVDKEEEIAAVRTIEEDGERQKEDAEREHQERLDAERGIFNERAQIQTKQNNVALEAEKKASDQRLVKLEEKQNAEKKDLAKKAAAVQYMLSLAGFFVSQNTARAMAKIEYASALMSAATAAARTAAQSGIFAGIATGVALTTMATLAFASTNAVIASTPPPMPPAELFAEQGGLVPGPRHSQGGVKAEVEGGEYIMPRGPAMANLGMLDAMREGRENAGGGVTVIMHVGSMDPGGRSVEAIGRELGLSVRAHL